MSLVNSNLKFIFSKVEWLCAKYWIIWENIFCYSVTKGKNMS